MNFKHLVTCCIATIMILMFLITWNINKACLQKSRPYVLCTTSIIADTVKNICKDRIDVICLMGPGIDPHLYKPVESNLLQIAQANIIFYNGLHLEAKMADLFEHLAQTHTTIAISKDIARTDVITVNDFEQIYDPHIWFDMQLWSCAVQTICASLIEKFPEYELFFIENTEQYLIELKNTSDYIEQILAQIPTERRILITGHDAFSYFARCHNFQVMGLQGMSTESCPGIYDINQIANYICQHNIPAIFIESCIPIKNCLALQQAAASCNHTVTIGGQLYADALGDATSSGNTYLNMLLANAQTIAAALHS